MPVRVSQSKLKLTYYPSVAARQLPLGGRLCNARPLGLHTLYGLSYLMTLPITASLSFWWTRGELEPMFAPTLFIDRLRALRKPCISRCAAPLMRGFNRCSFSKKKDKGANAPVSFFLVDPRGVEPLSESPLIRLSPWAVCYLEFPLRGVSRQTLRQGSHFVHDRFNGETPMHGHRCMTLESRARSSGSNG